MDNEKPDKEEKTKNENPLEELKKQLEGIFGGNPLNLNSAGLSASLPKPKLARRQCPPSRTIPTKF